LDDYFFPRPLRQDQSDPVDHPGFQISRAEVIGNDAELLESLHDPVYGGKPERVILFHVEAWDINCQQHITPRFTEEEFARRGLTASS